MGVHEDILKKGGEEIRNSAGIGSFSNGMLFIWIIQKKWVTKNIYRNIKEVKVVNETVGKP